MNKLLIVLICLPLLSSCFREEASFRRTDKIQESKNSAESARMRMAAYSRGGGREGRQSWVFAGPKAGQWLEIVDRYDHLDGQVRDEFSWRSNFVGSEPGRREIEPGTVVEGRLEGTLDTGCTQGSWKDPDTGWTFVMADGRLTVLGTRSEEEVRWTLLRESYSHEATSDDDPKPGDDERAPRG